MRKFTITYKDETILKGGQVCVAYVPFGTMEENEGEFTIRLKDYQNTVFIVQEEK